MSNVSHNLNKDISFTVSAITAYSSPFLYKKVWYSCYIHIDLLGQRYTKVCAAGMVVISTEHKVQ